MTRAHLEPKPIVTKAVDGTAVIHTDATIDVYKPGTLTHIPDTMYTTGTGPTPQTQSWNPTDGFIEFYTDYSQIVDIGVTIAGVQTIKPDISVGVPYGDNNILTYGCRPTTGFDNKDELAEAFIGTMTDGSFRYIPAESTFDTTETPLLPTNFDGWCIRGAGSGGTNRPSTSVIRAKASLSVGALPALMAPLEWWTNGVTEDTGQGWCLKDFSLDGNGFPAGRIITSAVETTSKAVHGLVCHGSGALIDHVTVVSANQHGIYFPGVGRDLGSGSATIGESHEMAVDGAAVRWTGADGIHVGPGQQDAWVQFSKIQYSGGHNIFTDNMTPGWSFIHNHPSWAAKDSIHCESGWNYRIAYNYIGSIGEYMDGAALTHYAIYMSTGAGQPAHIDHNAINTNTAGGQVDPVWGVRISGWVNCTDNTMVYQTGDNIAGMVQVAGTLHADSVNDGNHAHAA